MRMDNKNVKIRGKDLKQEINASRVEEESCIEL